MQTQSFAFAGFTFPRTVPMLPKGTPASRLAKRRASGPSPFGPYQTAPKPNQPGAFFYLDSDFQPGLRWQWADDVASSIRHTGWHTYPGGVGDTIRGLVARLPRGRGFLAGWSMGEGMASELETDSVYHDETSAAYAADSLAESAAESEREYKTAWQAGSRFADLGDQIRDARREALTILRDRRTASGSATLCKVIRDRLESLLESIRDARQERERLASGDDDRLCFYPDARLSAAFNEGAGAAVLA